MRRRDFLKTTTAAGLSASIPLQGNFGSLMYENISLEPAPDPAQKAFMELDFGMFIHFGINTYYDKEWSDGTLDISVFQPENLNTDQWAKVARDAGMKYMVLVAKHHDGFCLFNTKHTGYSVGNTPYKKDIVAQFCESARKFGLKPGLYYSLWDANNPVHNENEYAYVMDFMLPQLEELSTQYGDLCEFWFDGFWKKQQTGWKGNDGEFVGTDDFINAWRSEGAFRWQMDYVYTQIKKWQPQCMILNNPTSAFKTVPLHPVDAVCAERGTELDHYRKVWPWLGKEKFFPLQVEATMSVKGNDKFPSGNWFWHDWDHSVASVETIKQWLDNTHQLNGNLLLNVGPMSNGELRPEDVKTLQAL